MIKVLSILISVLPEVIRIIMAVRAEEKAKNTDAKIIKANIKNDFKKINMAFRNRDANILNDLFNGVSDTPKKEAEHSVGDAGISAK